MKKKNFTKNKKKKNRYFDSLTIYLNEISKIPLLTAEQEYEICKKISELTDKLNNLEKEYNTKKINLKEYEKERENLKEILNFNKNRI